MSFRLQRSALWKVMIGFGAKIKAGTPDPANVFYFHSLSFVFRKMYILQKE